MVSRNTIAVLVGMSILAAMFLLGQQAWNKPCTVNEDCTAAVEFCQKAVGDCEGKGMCQERPGPCLDYWDPVCGCDGVTYSNACYAAASGVSIDYEGECIAGPTLEGYSNSGCLSGPESSLADDQYPWCGDDAVEVAVEAGTIHLAHRNATYNCCVDDIRVTLDVNGNVLSLWEEEILPSPCDCLCCYDVKSTVVKLSPGTYVIEYCWFDYETGGTVCHRQEVEVP